MWNRICTLLCVLVLAWSAFAQDGKKFTEAQLDQLLAPIALYPDPLLAQILPAAAYPTEIQAAAAYVAQNPDGKDLDNQPWDASVKAIARYPEVVKLMAEDIQWTTQLGEAFADQSEDVTGSVQRLRRQAHEAGNLVSGTQQTVTDSENYVSILPTDPQYIYVPTYDPGLIYNTMPFGYNSPSMFFGLRSFAGPWLNMGFDWWGNRCFYYPTGSYWGCNNLLYNNYCNAGWVRNNYSYCNSWSLNRNRYRDCRPYRSGYRDWCNNRNVQAAWVRRNFTIQNQNNWRNPANAWQTGARNTRWNTGPNATANLNPTFWNQNTNRPAWNTGAWNRNTPSVWNPVTGTQKNPSTSWNRPNSTRPNTPRTTWNPNSWSRPGNNPTTPAQTTNRPTWNPGSWSSRPGNNTNSSWNRPGSTATTARPSWNSGSWSSRPGNTNSSWSRPSTTPAASSRPSWNSNSWSSRPSNTNSTWARPSSTTRSAPSWNTNNSWSRPSSTTRSSSPSWSSGRSSSSTPSWTRSAPSRPSSSWSSGRSSSSSNWSRSSSSPSRSSSSSSRSSGGGWRPR